MCIRDRLNYSQIKKMLMQCLLLFLIFSLTPAWDSLAPGIDYQHFRHENTNDIYVVRVDRGSPNVIIDTMIAGKKVKGNLEPTSSLFKRYNDSLAAWPNNQLQGVRYKAVAAVNGYYFDMTAGGWISGGVANGWYVKRFDNMKARDGRASGYSIKGNGEIFIGECVDHAKKNYLLIVKSGVRIEISDVNVQTSEDSVILYTPLYDKATPASNSGVEVVLEVKASIGLSTEKQKFTGTVRLVLPNRGNTQLYFDTIVISAKGKHTLRLQFLTPGDTVEIHQNMAMYDERTCTKSVAGKEWAGTYSSLALDYHYLKDGKRVVYEDEVRHPRTAMAFNSKFVYFYVVDGRTSKSRGMRIDEMSKFAQNYLNATEGGALDGGGSSTIIVNGKIMNEPSDEEERDVANAVLIAVPVHKEVSSKFVLNDIVVTVARAELYLGPGKNYNVMGVERASAKGIVMAHELGGVRATGDYWWKVHIGNSIAWIEESKLKKL
eukprot:TRINITY_DN13846_c0_g2_i2.p1 TRINITY_DN13846_c0_g2~~TRINITY_DN13846_c0_g2_i2.p1  ORF type:complete len:490 (-),score=87.45 TRINITY_DN13846_c0_g2_i2:112-1581(-)